MFDLKLVKIFKDEKTTEDIYLLAIKLANGSYYNLNVTKKDFDDILNNMQSIKNSGEI